MLSFASGLAAGLVYFMSQVTSMAIPGPVWASVLAGGVAVSFVNHVVLVVMVRASTGKALVGTSVVRSSDGGRPRLHQALGRWLGGFLFGLIVVPLAFALGGSEAEPQDFAGLRIIHPSTSRA